MQATGQLMDAAAYRPLIVAYRNGSPVRLDELGQASSTAWRTTRSPAGSTTTARSCWPSSGSPAPTPSRWWTASRKLLPTFRKQLPASVSLDVLYDRSETIRESVHDVQFTLLLTIGLVVLVIFLFLRNVSATLIPSLAVPLSIVGTFAVMYLLGYTIDNISLMALTLCVGFVVDDAIVMLENIVRHMEAGMPPHGGGLQGRRARSASRSCR